MDAGSQQASAKTLVTARLMSTMWNRREKSACKKAAKPRGRGNRDDFLLGNFDCAAGNPLRSPEATKKMIQPEGTLINIGLLLDAIGAAGGLVRFARKSGVDTSKVNMLLAGKIPNPGPLWRICHNGMGVKVGELVFNAAAHSAQNRKGQLLSYRRTDPKESAHNG